jgi:hypothetical protein
MPKRIQNKDNKKIPHPQSSPKKNNAYKGITIKNIPATTIPHITNTPLS